MSFRRSALLLAALCQTGSPKNGALDQAEPTEVSDLVSALAEKLQGVESQATRLTEESLPQVQMRPESWADSMGIAEVLRDCIQAAGAICPQTSQGMICFSPGSEDKVPVQIRIEETWENKIEGWGFKVRVNPVNQELNSMDFAVGPQDGSKGGDLSLACHEAREVLKPRKDLSDLCGDNQDRFGCDQWMIGAIESTTELKEKLKLGVELVGTLSDQGWPVKKDKSDDFHFTVDLGYPLSLRIGRSFYLDMATIRLEVPFFGPNDLWCEDPCRPEDLVVNLENPGFREAMNFDSNFVSVAYGVSYP